MAETDDFYDYPEDNDADMGVQREVISPGQVAEMFGVDLKTVQRWSDAGKLPHFRTLGGHRRFYKDEVERLARG